MNLSNFLLSTFVIGLSYSVLAILIERVLIYYGIARGNTVGLVIVVFFFAFLKQLVDYSGSVYLYGLFIIFIGPLGVNRADLIDTIMRGRWWWKTENQSNNQ